MVLDKTIPHIGKFTKIPLNLFFMVGICVLRWTPKEKPKWLQYCFIAILLFHIGTCGGGMLAYLVYGPLDTSLEKTASIIYITFTGNGLIKLFCCFYNLKPLRLVLRNFEKCYPKTVQEREDFRLDEHLKSIQKYNKGLAIYQFFVTGMFNLFPLIQSIIIYYQNGKRLFPYELPFPMVSIFDSKKGLGYAFAYFMQFTASFSASCGVLASDLLLLTCVHLINMNFKCLAKTIRNFQPTGTLKDVKTLKSFIKFHDDILKTVDLVNDVFSVSSFLNYLCTGVVTCLIGFQLVAGSEFLDLVKFLLLLISVLTRVFFISISSTELMAQGFDVSEAFMYHSWYDGHVEYRRAMILAIARSQKSVHLNAFKFFVISMETFKSLISVSYQFFTLIKTSYVEK